MRKRWARTAVAVERFRGKTPAELENLFDERLAGAGDLDEGARKRIFSPLAGVQVFPVAGF